MYRGITPTYILTLPNDIDLGAASHVYVTFADDKGRTIEKKDGDLSIDANEISVFLTQDDTLKLRGKVALQVNWTYDEDGISKRACSTIAAVPFTDNLIDRVIE